LSGSPNYLNYLEKGERLKLRDIQTISEFPSNLNPVQIETSPFLRLFSNSKFDSNPASQIRPICEANVPPWNFALQLRRRQLTIHHPHLLSTPHTHSEDSDSKSLITGTLNGVSHRKCSSRRGPKVDRQSRVEYEIIHSVLGSSGSDIMK
jgi:hypothetical protein